MDRTDFEMEYPNILSNFKNFSSTYYIYSAAFTALINVLVMCMLAAQKTPKYGSKFKFNNVMLFSLALCDLIYEVTTTSLFLLHANSWKDHEDTEMLYFIYLASNLCTLFHIIVLSFGKMAIGSDITSHSPSCSGLRRSIVAWLSAFALAYVCIKNDIGLMDKSIVRWLGSFKAFGYLLHHVIFCSGILLTFLSFCLSVSVKKSKKALFDKVKGPEVTQHELLNANTTRSLSQDDIMVSFFVVALFVGWFGWVILGVDCSTLLTIEVMKSFEIIRLGARIIGPAWLLFSFVLCLEKKKVLHQADTSKKWFTLL